MTEKRPKDKGYETFQPLLEDVLDRHQAELFEELARLDILAERRHRELLAAIGKAGDPNLAAGLAKVADEIDAVNEADRKAMKT